MEESQQLLTTSEAAALLNIASTTLRLWANGGKVAYTTTLGGHRRFTRSTIEDILNKTDKDKLIKILIVEDDEQLGDLIIQTLAVYLPECEFLLAKDGYELGNFIHTFRPTTIVLDLFMPHEDGFSICTRLKSDKNFSHISVIAITGQYSEAVAKKIKSLGASYCLPKPIDFTFLVKCITLLSVANQV